MTIRSPGPNRQPEDRFLQCEQELEAAFQDLIAQAVKAGWGEREACVAITALADHNILASSCNAWTDASVRKLKE